MSSPIQARLDFITKRWGTDLPNKSLWLVDIEGAPSADIINAILDDTDDRDRVQADSQVDINTLRHDKFGCLIATDIALPPENVNISDKPISPFMGGLLPGFHLDRRVTGTQNRLDITFLDLNESVMSFYFKPWAIAAAHQGLIEASELQNIKGTIRVVRLTRSNADNSVLPSQRDSFTFEKCCPIAIDGDTLSYNPWTYDQVRKRVTFNYSRYKMWPHWNESL